MRIPQPAPKRQGYEYFRLLWVLGVEEAPAQGVILPLLHLGPGS